MAKAGIQFSKKDQWNTPKEVVDFFGPFDYDPATTKEQAKHLGIPNYDTIRTDGLTSNWYNYSRIFCNPPFTRKFEFLKKAIETTEQNVGVRIFFLLPIESMTTKAFHEIVGDRNYILHLPNGRIKFDDGSGKTSSPAFGSVILEFSGLTQTKKIKHWRLYDNR